MNIILESKETQKSEVEEEITSLFIDSWRYSSPSIFIYKTEY